MWSRMRRNGFLWSLLGAALVTYVARMMNANRQQRNRMRQMNGMVDLLTRTGRNVADGTMRLVRR